ncbi:hypothetical protein ACWDBW_22590 [Streptomyces sp. NPDC001107]
MSPRAVVAASPALGVRVCGDWCGLSAGAVFAVVLTADRSSVGSACMGRSPDGEILQFAASELGTRSRAVVAAILAVGARGCGRWCGLSAARVERRYDREGLFGSLRSAA